MSINVQRAISGTAASVFFFCRPSCSPDTSNSRDVLAARRGASGCAASAPYLWVELWPWSADRPRCGCGNFAHMAPDRLRRSSARDYAARLWLVAATGAARLRLSSSCSARTRSSRTMRASSPLRTSELAAPWLLRTVVINWLLSARAWAAYSPLHRLERAAQNVRGGRFSRSGCCLWGQGNLWNADYGVLAGQDLDLAANAWRAPYELGGWAAALLLAAGLLSP